MPKEKKPGRLNMRSCTLCSWCSPLLPHTDSQKLLDQHYRTKHAGHRYYCLDCNYNVAFSARSNIKRHAKAAHGRYQGEELRVNEDAILSVSAKEEEKPPVEFRLVKAWSSVQENASPPSPEPEWTASPSRRGKVESDLESLLHRLTGTATEAWNEEMDALNMRKDLALASLPPRKPRRRALTLWELLEADANTIPPPFEFKFKEWVPRRGEDYVLEISAPGPNVLELAGAQNDLKIIPPCVLTFVHYVPSEPDEIETPTRQPSRWRTKPKKLDPRAKAESIRKATEALLDLLREDGIIPARPPRPMFMVKPVIVYDSRRPRPEETAGPVGPVCAAPMSGSFFSFGPPTPRPANEASGSAAQQDDGVSEHAEGASLAHLETTEEMEMFEELFGAMDSEPDGSDAAPSPQHAEGASQHATTEDMDGIFEDLFGAADSESDESDEEEE